MQTDDAGLRIASQLRRLQENALVITQSALEEET